MATPLSRNLVQLTTRPAVLCRAPFGRNMVIVSGRVGAGGVVANCTRRPVRFASTFEQIGKQPAKQFWGREVKVWVGLAAATLVGTIIYQRLSHLPPGGAEELIVAAYQHRSAGKHKQELEVLLRAQKLLEDWPFAVLFNRWEVQIMLGDAHESLEDLAAAESCYRQALLLCEEMKEDFSPFRAKTVAIPMRTGVTLDRLAQIHHDRGDNEAAFATYDEAIATMGEFMKSGGHYKGFEEHCLQFAGVYNNKGRLLFEQAKLQEARVAVKNSLHWCRRAIKAAIAVPNPEEKYPNWVSPKDLISKAEANAVTLLAAIEKAQQDTNRRLRMREGNPWDVPTGVSAAVEAATKGAPKPKKQ